MEILSKSISNWEDGLASNHIPYLRLIDCWNQLSNFKTFNCSYVSTSIKCNLLFLVESIKNWFINLILFSLIFAFNLLIPVITYRVSFFSLEDSSII